MKKNIIFAAFAAASALLLVSSCAKEQLRENINTGDGKVFSAAISQDLTKTTITGEYKVNWVEGDQIDIKGSIFSATPDASDATKATFTKVSGSDPTPDYTAVYPASIMVGTQATLPATQTYAAGKFNAPMCAMSSTESLEFKNFCGVLCFALKGTDKVKSIAVTAKEQVCGPFEFADATSFSFSGKNEGYTVTLDCGEGVQLDASTATSFYISLPPATYTAGMEIVATNTEGKTFKKTTTKSAVIARNKIYTFNWTASFSPAELEYVEIGGLKWATMNLGAEKVTDCGDYFAWGEKAPYYEGTGGWPTTPTWKSGKESGYAWQSYCGSSSFSEWSTPPYDATSKILKPEFDAAAQIFGDGWRMPTKDDFTSLANACNDGGYTTGNIALDGSHTNISTAVGVTAKGIYFCKNYEAGDGIKGLLFHDGINKLFFPAAGFGSGTSLTYFGISGRYWSSTWNNTGSAYYLLFSSSNVKPQSSDIRYYGYLVRPVKDAAPAPTPTTTGTAKATIGGKDVDVKWVQLWANGPKFAEYNVGAENNKPEDYGCLYGWGGTEDKNTNDYNKGSVPLTGDDDTATNLWGSNWRMPTDEELKPLQHDVNCTCTWTEDYNGSGVNGLLCTGKGAYSSNSIFLPAAGEVTAIPRKQNVIGRYWSSTPKDENWSFCIFFDSEDTSVNATYHKYCYSVRAVLAK